MPEENTTESKAPIDPELEDGELSEEDLEAAAGGSIGHGSERPPSTVANLTSPSFSRIKLKLPDGP